MPSKLVLCLRLVGITAGVAPVSAAWAQAGEATPVTDAPPASRTGEPVLDDDPLRPQYDHRGQFAMTFQPGTGYRAIFPYDEEYCGTPDRVCTGRSPFFLDLGAGYAVTSGVTLLLDVRLGLEKDFTMSSERPRTLALAPGVKLFVDDEGSTKFFSTLQASFDFTDFSGSGSDVGTDIAVRNVNGFQVDVHRSLGVFIHAGMTVGFVRWLRFELDGGVGVQARFP